MIYGERNTPINIGKARENFDKNRKLRCFNCNTYGYMVKEYRKPKKEQDTRKCYKCNKVGYIAKDYRSEQKMKNHSIQEKTDDKKDDKQEGFGEGPE